MRSPTTTRPVAIPTRTEGRSPIWSRPHRLDHCKPGPDGVLSILLVGLRIAEIDQDAIAHVLGYEAAEPGHRLGHTSVIGSDHVAQVFRIEAGGQGGCEGSYRITEAVTILRARQGEGPDLAHSRRDAHVR
jgi:hypothetical protein